MHNTCCSTVWHSRKPAKCCTPGTSEWGLCSVGPQGRYDVSNQWLEAKLVMLKHGLSSSEAHVSQHSLGPTTFSAREHAEAATVQQP